MFLICELVPVSHWLSKSRMRNNCFTGQVPISTGHAERDVHVTICPHCLPGSWHKGKILILVSYKVDQFLNTHNLNFGLFIVFTYWDTSIIATFKINLLRFSYLLLLFNTLCYVVVFLRFMFYRRDYRILNHLNLVVIVQVLVEIWCGFISMAWWRLL